MDDFAGSHLLGSFPELSEDRLIGGDFVAAHAGNDKTKIELCQVVLVLKIFVYRHKDIKASLSILKQWPVLAAAPSNFRDGLDDMAGKYYPHACVDALV